MSLIIKSVHCADIEYLESWMPSSPEDVYFSLQMEIGEEGTPDRGLYDVIIATEEGLRSFKNKYKIPGQHFKNQKMLIVKNYNWQSIFAELSSTVKASSHTKLIEWFNYEYV